MVCRWSKYTFKVSLVALFSSVKISTDLLVRLVLFSSGSSSTDIYKVYIEEKNALKEYLFWYNLTDFIK